MSDDIVSRLRRLVVWSDGDIGSEAADEIERLRADRDRWRKIADGMANCLDSSIEAGEWLQDFEQAVVDEQG